MSRGSVLPEGMTLAGEIRGQGDLVVAGVVEGPIAIDGHLTIEASGSVRGEVKARAMVLRGTLAGAAIADETIRLEPGARMVGDARAERVSVVEGAMLRGRITMTGAQPARRSSAGDVAAAGSASEGRIRGAAGVAPMARSIAAADAPAAAPASGTDVARAAGIAPRPAAGVLVAPRERRPSEPVAPRERRPSEPVAPSERRPSEPNAPRERRPADPAAELDARPTGRFVRRGEPAAPAAPIVGEGARTRPDRRPPEPVIPSVGRQRARRKDGGLAT